MNFIEELGILALGTRIKSLSELLMKDVTRIYKDQEIDFEPRWFTFFQLLLHRGEITVTEIARELNQTHPAVIQVIHSLEKRKLISTKKDKTDQRKRLVSLTKKGKKLASDLKPVWNAIHQSAKEILEESDPALIEHIMQVEKALEQKSTYHRVEEILRRNTAENIEFVAFEEKYQKDFRQLNENWLNTYLEITEHDRQLLDDPVKEIINNKGMICLMISGRRVVGTYALQKRKDRACELSKFTVKEEFRGLKLGERMLEHAIQQAQNLGYDSVLLFTHHKLSEATHLYLKKGFKEISEHPDFKDETGRCSMMMKLIINQ